MNFTEGNLLEAEAEALVNTVNTVGVMGKGIALMFKESFPKNFEEYAIACGEGAFEAGELFVTETGEDRPRWVVNFATKAHWRTKTRIEWVESGLVELRQWIEKNGVRSIAIPPLGCGNGGLAWPVVRTLIEESLGDLENCEVIVYEPTRQYQNVAKKQGVEKLTPARALITEMVRRYEVLGMDCSKLEIQKLGWFLTRSIDHLKLPDPLKLRFEAHRYGPYSNPLEHLLNALDGSYLGCAKRIADADPWERLWFVEEKGDKITEYLHTDALEYVAAVELTDQLIDGFQSPLGVELLATLDWLIHREKVAPNRDSIREGLNKWRGGDASGERKNRIFKDHMIDVALERLASSPLMAS